MFLDISNYKTLNEFFGDIISKMKNDSLRNLLTEGYENPLIQLDEMFEILKKNTNVKELIKEYKTKYITDINRFDSLISEIRAGFFLLKNGFPVQFLNTEDDKTPDIKTKILNRYAFVEVKRISQKKSFYEGSIDKELKSKKINFDLDVYIQKRFYKASDIAEALINNLPPSEKITEEFVEYDFPYGQFNIKKTKGKPIYYAMISETVPAEKSSIYDHEDANISREQLNETVLSDLEEGIIQLISYAKKDELCFILLDNHDAFNYSHFELEELLYNGGEIIVYGKKIEYPYKIIPKALESKKHGWNLLLADLLYDPPKLDYSSKNDRGWFDYSPDAQHLNGVFYLEGGDFKYRYSTCMLNPFVENNRNYPTLEKMDYYKRGKNK